MDRLFIESASGRRRFLDRLVLGFDAGHARAATRYETAMRERARLLKFGPRDPAWLDGLENEMAEAGVAIAIARAARPSKRLNRALAERGQRRRVSLRALALTGEADHCCASADAEPCASACRAARMRDAEARPHDLSARISPTSPCATRRSAPMRATAPPANRRRF